MSSVFGTLFRVATFGESHGGAVGAVVDGCPPRLELGEADIQPQLDRRRPGQSRLTTSRNEPDRVRILSGVFEGRTLGSPLLLLVENQDARSKAYASFKDLYRPSHADFTYQAKYGFRTWQGGGRASARETVGRVAAGAVAEKLLRLGAGVEIVAWVAQVGEIEAPVVPLDAVTNAVPGTKGRSARGSAAEPTAARGTAGRARDGRATSGKPSETGGTVGKGRSRSRYDDRSPIDPRSVTRAAVDRNAVRCPHADTAGRMIEAIDAIRREGDSLGGVVELVIRGLPAGLGEPVFDKLEADLGKAMLSLPACKGVEVGSGFAGTRLRGSEHNDPFVARRRVIGTEANRSGGIQGGISNGEPVLVRAAFKPTVTIRKPQRTVDASGRSAILEAQGRHDPCVLPRAVPLVEAMAALVLADHWLRQLALETAAGRVSGGPVRRRP